MIDFNLMAKASTVVIALSLMALAWDWRQQRVKRETKPPGRLRLHWAWLVVVSLLLTGGGFVAVGWFADVAGQVVIGYSGE